MPANAPSSSSPSPWSCSMRGVSVAMASRRPAASPSLMLLCSGPSVSMAKAVLFSARSLAWQRTEAFLRRPTCSMEPRKRHTRDWL